MKTIFFLIGLVILGLFSFSSCKKPRCTGGDPNACVCLEIYAPVCGCDGVTYENDCRAECAGVNVEYAGSCK